MIHEIKLYAHLSPWNRRIEFLIAGYDPLGKPFDAVLPEFIEHEPGAAPQPTFSLEMENAQQLMDELWNCGLRPTEGTGSAGAMAATQAHLKDLQKIVDKVLPVAIKQS